MEWMTYLRRPPVRYPRSGVNSEIVSPATCQECKSPETRDNPLHLAHRINALNGVRFLGLTPDFLDDPAHLVWAHKRVRNRKVELDYEGTLEYLIDCGIYEIPDFLPERVRKNWRALSKTKPEN